MFSIRDLMENSKFDGMTMKIYKAEEKHILTIINVYAPTAALIKKDNSILDDLYLDLSNLLNEQKSCSTMTILAGDFNAKVDKRKHTDINFLGKFSRGRTNNSGKTLIDFCSINHLFISNSAFQHPARHITTWESQIKVDNKLVKVYNQIDYRQVGRLRTIFQYFHFYFQYSLQQTLLFPIV